MKSICILDYGLGNIRSLYNSIAKIGFVPELFSSRTKKKFDLIFIPGVGSFHKGSKLLKKAEIKKFLNEHIKETKIFGICLGMQLLLSRGFEIEESEGLNLIEGEVKKINNNSQKLILPFVGYQEVQFDTKQISFLKKYDKENFYFIHSFEAEPHNKNNVLATTNSQGKKYCAAIVNDNIIGTQFHPEKSGEMGLEFLKDVIVNL